MVFKNGVLEVEVGSIEHLMLSIMECNRSKMTSSLWLYRNRKRISKEVVRVFKKNKEGRRLLKKYGISN
jgi:hypothetical protein